eukprot:jgi/Mesvir1/2889/Mv13963-RA.1
MREYVAVPEVPVAPACDPIPTSVAPPVEPVATALSTGSASSSSGSVLPPPTAAVPLAGPTDAAAARSALPADGAGHSYRRLTALELAEQGSDAYSAPPRPVRALVVPCPPTRDMQDLRI